MGLCICFITKVAQQEDENPSKRSRILRDRQPKSHQLCEWESFSLRTRVADQREGRSRIRQISRQGLKFTFCGSVTENCYGLLTTTVTMSRTNHGHCCCEGTVRLVLRQDVSKGALFAKKTLVEEEIARKNFLLSLYSSQLCRSVYTFAYLLPDLMAKVL